MLKPVSVQDMAAAREARAAKQIALLERYRVPLISFTMNIAGPFKDSSLIRRGFLLGLRQLRRSLMAAGMTVTHMESFRAVTGSEALLCVDAEAGSVKKLTCEIEDADALGRLFDLDVITPDGGKIDRTSVGLTPRACLLCGNPATICARSRAHTVQALQRRTQEILQSALEEADAEDIAQAACRALLTEACVTPKPGLVDCENSGSHRDMDLFSFMNSASALRPYMKRCAEAGLRTAASPADQTFRQLQRFGRQAEGVMLEATGGVNTHKGAIFALGIVCGALGRLSRSAWADASVVLAECAALAKGLSARAFAGITIENARTHGERLYALYGLTGARGQAEEGFPTVLFHGFPALKKALAERKSLNDAGRAALLSMLAADMDTNMVFRGGLETAQAAVLKIQALLEKTPYPSRDEISRLNDYFVERNLSPGGAADLLSVCFLLHFISSVADEEWWAKEAAFVFTC